MNVIETIFSRASVRMFKPDPIPNEIVNRILKAGIRAPIAGGVEKWFFIIVKSEDKRKKIYELLMKAHVIYAKEALRKPYSERAMRKWIEKMRAGMYYAPLYIAGYIDMGNPRLIEKHLEEEKIFLHQSIAAAFENMILTAWSMGIGSVWLGVPLFIKEEFNKILNPPSKLELAGILALGYPAEKTKPKKRKTLREISKKI